MSIPAVPDTLNATAAMPRLASRRAAHPRHRHRGGRPRLRDGAGCPALNDTQVFFAMDKGEAKSDLVALRRQICERFIREPGYRFVELADPPARQGRRVPAGRRRLACGAGRRLGATPSNANSRPTASAPFWPGVTRRCTTARCESSTWWPARRYRLRRHPRITAIQALTARHRIPLNDIGEPVLITTGRRLRATGCRAARGDARRRLRVSVVSAGHPDLVGRLPRHAGRAAGVGHCRRSRRADRRTARRGPRETRLDHGHISVARNLKSAA